MFSFYRLQAKLTSKKGYALILNHEQFKNKEMNREGSRRDEEALSRMFTHFGFSLTVKRNKKFSEIQALVKERKLFMICD